MNRKGKYFTLLILFFYLLVSIWALVVVSQQFMNRAPVQGVAIGEYQGALLSAAERAEQKSFFARAAAEQAITQALTKLFTNPRAFFTTQEGDTSTPPPCGAYGYQLFDCIEEQLVRTTFTQTVKKKLAGLLSSYPGGFGATYEVVPQQQLDFSTTLQEPILLDLPSAEESGAAARHFNDQDVMGELTWPMTGAKYVTSCYGPRTGIAWASSNFHHGIDIRASGEVVAAADGVVMNEPSTTTEGTIFLQHDGFITAYLHLDKSTITVHQGDSVKRGQVLGTPNPNYRGGAHLHFEVLVPQPPKGGVYTCTNRPGMGCDLNPVCFFAPSVRDKLRRQHDTNDNACQRQGSAAPAAWCDAYDLTLTPATIHQPGTAIRRKKEGEAGPPTTTAVEGVRPDTHALTQAQQAKFHQTEQNRYKYGWDQYVIKAAAEQGVDQALLLGLITQESLGDPHAISWTGCAGLMQICMGTGEKYPSLKGHMTRCLPNNCHYGSCTCNEANDRRFLPSYAVPVGAALLRENLNTFANAKDTETRWAFALAAYNGGPAVVKRAIQATGKAQPAWEDVAKALKKHPDIITYVADAQGRERKAQEIVTYVNNVLAFAHAWNGGVAPVSTPTVDATKIGDYQVPDHFSLPAGLDSYLELVTWARRTIEECKKSPVPATCLANAMKQAGVLEFCDEDSTTLALYEALRDCAENGQYNCQCKVPRPVQAALTFTKSTTWNTVVGNLTLDEPFGTRTVLVETSDQAEGVVPDKLSFKEGKLTYDKAETTWEKGWVVEKNKEGNLIFRQSASGVPACAPVKKKYTFCKAFAQGLPAARFALTLLDDEAPAPPTGLRVQDGEVLFTPSASPDASYYNVYDQAPRAGVAPVAQILQAAATSFDASAYAGKTLYVTTVDRAGNEGQAASVTIPS